MVEYSGRFATPRNILVANIAGSTAGFLIKLSGEITMNEFNKKLITLGLMMIALVFADGFTISILNSTSTTIWWVVPLCISMVVWTILSVIAIIAEICK